MSSTNPNFSNRFQSGDLDIECVSLDASNWKSENSDFIGSEFNFGFFLHESLLFCGKIDVFYLELTWLLKKVYWI